MKDHKESRPAASTKPEGVQKGKAGRPSLYRPEYREQIVEFFDIEPYTEKQVTYITKNGIKRTDTIKVANTLRFIVDFEMKCGIPHQMLVDWIEVHPYFLAAYMRARARESLQPRYIATNSLYGTYNATFAAFVLKNLTGWQDKSTIAQKVTGDINVTVVSRFGEKNSKPVDKDEVDRGLKSPESLEKNAI